MPDTPDDRKIQEQTARQLAITLAFALGATVVIQYVVLATLTLKGHEKAIPVFEHLFNSWLPVISGLSGSAVTYYLTKRPQLAPQRVPQQDTLKPPKVK